MIDTDFQRCGYTVPGEQECRALDMALGANWRNWATECANDPSVSSQNDLRSAMMAVSPITGSLFAGLAIWVPLERRIAVMVGAGRPLRAAIATLIREHSTVEQKSAAIEYIKSAFEISYKTSLARPVARVKASFEDKVHRVYGSKAAVTFEASTNKSQLACLQVEAAPRLESGEIDWSRKIIIQLGEEETLQLLAVLRGWATSMELSAHGDTRDKRMTFSRQKDKPGYLVSVRQGSAARVVPIPPFSAYRIIELVMRVLVQNAPNLTHALILEMAKDFSQQENAGHTVASNY